jgi:hypothetical protein
MYASEQYQMDEFMLSIPSITPRSTEINFKGDFTTSKSFAGSETTYATTTDVAIRPNEPTRFRYPHVIASKAQEDDAAKLNGNPSAVIKAVMSTSDQYNAPFINVSAGSIKTLANFIDYQDSDASSASSRNYITTIDYLNETNPDGGTTAAKHITIPFGPLLEAATSIRVYVDAVRPVGAEFSVWYRTAQSTSDQDISKKSWVEFSKTINPPNSSNYSQIGNTEAFRQFEFNVYDIADFDIYQIKITMNSTNSTVVPVFKNLRTIATV